MDIWHAYMEGIAQGYKHSATMKIGAVEYI
jgi:hypothetical protein